jgi:hypothetical protein
MTYNFTSEKLHKLNLAQLKNLCAFYGAQTESENSDDLIDIILRIQENSVKYFSDTYVTPTAHLPEYSVRVGRIMESKK